MSDLLYVPADMGVVAADSSNNAVFADVIGNKNDDALTQGASPSIFALSGGATRLVTVQTVDGSSTAWTIAAHRLFTVAGLIKCRIAGVVDETLTENNGDETIEVGIAGATAALIAQYATPLDLITGDIWTNGATSTSAPVGFPSDWAWLADTDIDLLVAGSTGINDGQITFYLEWVPLSVGATAVAAVWD
ncbi:hypothetical protein LCGC14_0602000 [marine sediment metagenome]|uniref:Uncharacterized protein n=1 Tax=marine sediment metagenome TaxID=412755 RepID=A0A0F9UIU7_9ZZZZ